MVMENLKSNPDNGLCEIYVDTLIEIMHEVDDVDVIRLLLCLSLHNFLLIRERISELDWAFERTRFSFKELSVYDNAQLQNHGKVAMFTEGARTGGRMHYDAHKKQYAKGGLMTMEGYVSNPISLTIHPLLEQGCFRAQVQVQALEKNTPYESFRICVAIESGINESGAEEKEDLFGLMMGGISNCVCEYKKKCKSTDYWELAKGRGSPKAERFLLYGEEVNPDRLVWEEGIEVEVNTEDGVCFAFINGERQKKILVGVPEKALVKFVCCEVQYGMRVVLKSVSRIPLQKRLQIPNLENEGTVAEDDLDVLKEAKKKIQKNESAASEGWETSLKGGFATHNNLMLLKLMFEEKRKKEAIGKMQKRNIWWGNKHELGIKLVNGEEIVEWEKENKK